MTHETAANVAEPAKAEFDYAAHTIANTALEVRKTLGLLTEEETAGVLQLTSTGTLATWRSQKKGPPSVKLGKKVFYVLPTLHAWISAEATQQAAA
jgi:hypothetical protein